MGINVIWCSGHWLSLKEPKRGQGDNYQDYFWYLKAGVWAKERKRRKRGEMKEGFAIERVKRKGSEERKERLKRERGEKEK